MNARPIVLLSGLALLSTPTLSGAVEGTAAAPVVIGMPGGKQGPYQDTLRRAAQQAAEQHGAELRFVDTWGSPAAQASGVASLVATGARGIVMSPIDGTVAPAIDAATKAGVPVATTGGSSPVTRNVLVHVGVDDVEVGRVAARFIIERLGNKGRVIELEGHYGTPGAVDRRTGFDQVMKKSSVKVVASQTASWSRAKAQDLMQVFIESYPKFDAVFAANDEMILGAIAAMEAANIDPASKVTVGVDASADALQYVKDGKLTATIGVAPDKQAVRAIDCLATFIDNKTRPPQPIVLLKPELIRKAP